MSLRVSAIALVGVLGALAGCTGDILDGGAGDQGPGPGMTPGQSPEGVTTPDGVGWATRFPKLSNEQWENSVRDLFYLDAPTGLAESFAPGPADGGYDNQAAAGQTIAGDAWQRYQAAAEALAQSVTGDAQKLAKLVPASAPSSCITCRTRRCS